jgi:hypothetical protein
MYNKTKMFSSIRGEHTWCPPCAGFFLRMEASYSSETLVEIYLTKGAVYVKKNC